MNQLALLCNAYKHLMKKIFHESGLSACSTFFIIRILEGYHVSKLKNLAWTQKEYKFKNQNQISVLMDCTHPFLNINIIQVNIALLQTRHDNQMDFAIANCLWSKARFCKLIVWLCDSIASTACRLGRQTFLPFLLAFPRESPMLSTGKYSSVWEVA